MSPILDFETPRQVLKYLYICMLVKEARKLLHKRNSNPQFFMFEFEALTTMHQGEHYLDEFRYVQGTVTQARTITASKDHNSKNFTFQSWIVFYMEKFLLKVKS